MINDDGEVFVVALVGDLIDPDPRQAVERVAQSPDVTHDPANDRADSPPRDTHQLGDRGLRGVPGTMTGPRHRSDGDAVITTRHPRCFGLDEHHHRARIQRPPPAQSLTRVLPGRAALTVPATMPVPLRRPHRNNHTINIRIVTDRLDTALCSTPNTRAHSLTFRTPSPHPSLRTFEQPRT